MKGQVSIELFFAFSVFILILFWFNNLVGVYRGNASPLVVQASAVSSRVVSLADAACALREEVSVALGCLVSEKGLVPYRLSFASSQANVSSTFGSVASTSSFCDFAPGFVDVSCGSDRVFCFRRVGDLVSFSDGGCVP